MADRLEVFLSGRLAGEIAIGGPLRSPEDWMFRYYPDYVTGHHLNAASVRMPVRRAPYAGALVRHWACNLLPEGDARRSIHGACPGVEIDDFELLALLGGECAGAVEFRLPGGEIANHGWDLDTADVVGLEPLVRRLDASSPWSPLNLPGRRALAGAQDKLAVVVEKDGFVRLPVDGEWSTHLIKPDSQRLPGLRDREAVGMALAEAVGIPVAKTRPIDIAGRRALLVERFDRVVTASGEIAPVHQEDFCQVLGLPSEFKYEAPSGASLADIATWCRHSLPPDQAAESELMSWIAFNLLIGNADAHAKNLSILHDPDGGRRLAPAYDLVPTLSFSEQLVDRAPALRIGDAERIDAVTRQDLVSLALACDWSQKLVCSRIRGLASEILLAMPTVEGHLTQQGCNATLLGRVREAVEAQCRRLSDLSSGDS